MKIENNSARPNSILKRSSNSKINLIKFQGTSKAFQMKLEELKEENDE